MIKALISCHSTKHLQLFHLSCFPLVFLSHIEIFVCPVCVPFMKCLWWQQKFLSFSWTRFMESLREISIESSNMWKNGEKDESRADSRHNECDGVTQSPVSQSTAENEPKEAGNDFSNFHFAINLWVDFMSSPHVSTAARCEPFSHQLQRQISISHSSSAIKSQLGFEIKSELF